MNEEIDLKSLVGPHVLSGVDACTENVKDTYGEAFLDCNVIRFTLDGKTYTSIENPEDGYRSSLGGTSVSDSPTKNTFGPIPVIASWRTEGAYSGVDEVLEIRDSRNGLLILEVGTENVADYYPCVVAIWNPKNMEENR